ncbi:hypothetical protein SAMN04489860_0627 [Paraoerskovia marina]|uniref:Helix-turn-helix domain-containing protein n=1 Tax=Paraoerskovia marina TaxID=545619 RepID=A0A1H1NVC6_9CELL|nr:hypothetical protein SAMN04489860_0627 [Paraoerskovia marina]
MAEPYPINAPAPIPAPTVRINARASLWRIVDTLAAAGWGELRAAPQSVRSYLLALARLADARTAVVEITDAQAAERAGVSTRTVLRARHWLQDHGIVTMLRRGARKGRVGVASLIRITKRSLIRLLPHARRAKDARAHARAERDGGAPNLTQRHPFPSLRRKTAAPRERGARRGPTPIQQQLTAEAASAAANPPRPETLATVRAMAGRRCCI